MRHTLQLIGIYDAHRTRQVGFLLHTITHYDHLVEHEGVRLKFNLIKVRTSAYGNLAILVTHIAHYERSISRSIQLEVTVVVGDSACLGTLHLDGGTNERLS